MLYNASVYSIVSDFFRQVPSHLITKLYEMNFNEKLFKTKHVGIVIQNDCHEKWIAIFKILTITYYPSLRI